MDISILVRWHKHVYTILLYYYAAYILCYSSTLSDIAIGARGPEPY